MSLGVDLTRPSAPRVYNVLVGGYGNFAPDREEARRLLKICPELGDMARRNRGFLTTATAWAAGHGTGQFIDLGAGMPLTLGKGLQEIREAAQAVNPAARCVYVDRDPIACSHSAALRANVWRDGDLENPEPVEGVAVLEADLTDPSAVLKDPALTAVIDLAEPVCAILGLVLHLLPARQAREVVTGYADLIAPGSLLVISCPRFDDEVLWKELRAACTTASPRNHTRRAITGFLAGLELVPPGLVAAQGWRGGWGDTLPTPPGGAYVLAGVARKP